MLPARLAAQLSADAVQTVSEHRAALPVHNEEVHEELRAWHDELLLHRDRDITLKAPYRYTGL